MRFSEKYLYDDKGNKIGVRVTVLENPVSVEDKVNVERMLFDHALQFTGKGLSAFRAYYRDMMGLVVFWDN